MRQYLTLGLTILALYTIGFILLTLTGMLSDPDSLFHVLNAIDTMKAKNVAENNVSEAINMCKNIIEEDTGDRDECLFEIAKHLAIQGKINGPFEICNSVEGRGFDDKNDCFGMIMETYLNSDTNASCDGLHSNYFKNLCYRHYAKFTKNAIACDKISSSKLMDSCREGVAKLEINWMNKSEVLDYLLKKYNPGTCYGMPPCTPMNQKFAVDLDKT